MAETDQLSPAPWPTEGLSLSEGIKRLAGPLWEHYKDVEARMFRAGLAEHSDYRRAADEAWSRCEKQMCAYLESGTIILTGRPEKPCAEHVTVPAPSVGLVEFYPGCHKDECVRWGKTKLYDVRLYLQPQNDTAAGRRVGRPPSDKERIFEAAKRLLAADNVPPTRAELARKVVLELQISTKPKTVEKILHKFGLPPADPSRKRKIQRKK